MVQGRDFLSSSLWHVHCAIICSDNPLSGGGENGRACKGGEETNRNSGNKRLALQVDKLYKGEGVE